MILSKPVAFLNLTLKLILSPIDYIEVIVGESVPLLLGSALELLPVAFDSIPVHDALRFFFTNGALFKRFQERLLQTCGSRNEARPLIRALMPASRMTLAYFSVSAA